MNTETMKYEIKRNYTMKYGIKRHYTMKYGIILLFILSISYQACAQTLKTECRGGASDIVFLIDSSGSVGDANFDQVRNFVKSVVSNLDLGPDAMQVGALTFHYGYTVQFHLNDFSSKQTIYSAIDEIPNPDPGWTTATREGIEALTTTMYTVQNGDRPEAPNIAIVITDGAAKTGDPAETATIAKARGIALFVIGIRTPEINIDEMRAIASEPVNDYVYLVDDFEALTEITDVVTQKTCIDVPVCVGNKADVVFLLDRGDGIGEENFVKMKQFIEDIVRSLEIGTTSNRVGVLSFASDTTAEFYMNTYVTKEEILTAIRSIEYTGGATAIPEALTALRQEMFGPGRGARVSARKFGVLITDGRSSTGDVTGPADAAKASAIQLFAVGIFGSNNMDINQLRTIASGPDSAFVYTVDDFNFSAEMVESISTGTCNQIVDCTTGKLDIVFILDSSGSMTSGNFLQMLVFVEDIVNDIDLGNVQIGVITFSTTARISIPLNKTNNKRELQSYIIDIKYDGGSTLTYDALKMAREVMFTPQYGDRDDASDLIILITDGAAKDKDPLPEAQSLKSNGVVMFVVYIKTDELTINEINALASRPTEKYAIVVDSFDELYTATNDLIVGACGVARPTLEPLTTPLLTTQKTTTLRTTPASTPRQTTTTSRTTAQVTTPRVVETECDGAIVDIVFVIDSSGSVGINNFRQVLAFVDSVVQQLDIGDIFTRVGAMTFDSFPQVQFHLNEHKTKAAVRLAISNIGYGAGGTATREALIEVRDNMLIASNGDRPTISNYIVFITDGNSKTGDPTPIAQQLKNAGATIIAIAIASPDLDIPAVQALASEPIEENSFIVDDFQALDGVTSRIVSGACTQEVDCSFGYVDLAFVIDASYFVGHFNFLQILEFTKDIIRNIDIGSDKFRVSIVTISDDARVELYLESFFTANAIIDAIDKIRYDQGVRDLSAALKKVREVVFISSNGDRSFIPNVAIVILSGKTANADIKTDVLLTKASGIIMFGVGIESSSLDMSEINTISSNPNRVFTYEVSSASRLTEIASSLSQGVCGPQVQQLECSKSKADIVYILDASESVGPDDFVKVRDFVRAITRELDVSPDTNRFAAISFSDGVTEHFFLDTFDNKQDVLDALQNISYVGGSTNTQAAFVALREDIAIPERGDREEIQTIAICLTDGASKVRGVREAATAVKDMGVAIIMIGVNTTSLSIGELNDVASEPTKDFSFVIENYSELYSISSKITEAACFNIVACVGNKVDLLFVVDASKSIDPTNFEIIRQFIRNIVRELHISKDAAQVGLVTFHNTVTHQWDLNTYHNKPYLLAAIDKISYQGGSTDTAGGLREAKRMLSDPSLGNRPGVQDIVVVITDGESKTDDPVPVANALRIDLGAVIFAIGIDTDALNPTELDGIASYPPEDFSFIVDDFNSLTSVTFQIVQASCGKIPSRRITTTLTPPTSVTGAQTTTAQGETTTTRGLPPTRSPRPTVGPPGQKPTTTITTSPPTTVTSTTTTTQRPTLPKGKIVNAELSFVIDASSPSFKTEQLESIENFMMEMLGGIEIGKESLQCAVTLITNKARVEFYLDSSEDTYDLYDEIGNLRLSFDSKGVKRSGGALDLGIEQMREEIFTKQNGMRDDYKTFGIVISDAGSITGNLPLQGNMAKFSNNIEMFVMYKNNTNATEAEVATLKRVATDDDHFMVSNSYESMQQYARYIMDIIEQNSVITRLAPTTKPGTATNPGSTSGGNTGGSTDSTTGGGGTGGGSTDGTNGGTTTTNGNTGTPFTERQILTETPTIIGIVAASCVIGTLILVGSIWAICRNRMRQHEKERRMMNGTESLYSYSSSRGQPTINPAYIDEDQDYIKHGIHDQEGLTGNPI